ncbi:hypothetical protein RB597_001295 [Gaeumannomyces tritici]
MPPKTKALEEALIAAARDIFNSSLRGELSVNGVRARVEQEQELESGFFTSANWKGRSKDIIKDAVDDLFANESEPAAESSSSRPKSEPEDSKNGLKRESSEEPLPAKKRQKREPSSSVSNKKKVAVKKSESSSELSDLSDEDVKPIKKRQKRESSSPIPAKKKAAVKKADSSSELSDLSEVEDVKPVKKRKAVKRATAAKKKRKTAPDSEDESDVAKDEDKSENEMSIKEDSESEVDTKPAKKKKAPVRKKAPPKRAAPKRKIENPTDSDDDDDEEKPVAKDERPVAKDEKPSEDEIAVKVDGDSETKSEPKKEPNTELADDVISVKQAVEKQEDDEDSPLSDVKEGFSDDDEKKAVGKNKPATVDYNSDSSMSIVYDEPPTKAKRGRKAKGKDASEPKAAKGTAKKPAGEGRKSTVAADAAASPDEAEIKKLQGYLVKCGVRKIWAFELKQHGDNAKAKIRHLREMLREIGMDGRFSEAKAREIKEMRELAADLEAVQEMNKSWGVGGRASRSRAAAAGSSSKKSIAESSGDEDGGDDDDNNDDEKPKKERNGSDDESGSDVKTFAKSRRDKRHADLAFLGDESESD